MTAQKKAQEIQELATVSSEEFYGSEDFGDVSDTLNVAEWSSLRDAADSRDHLTQGEAGGLLGMSLETFAKVMG